MRIYTSSYWNYRGPKGVQISNGLPDGVHVYRSLPILYPTWANVNAWNKVKKLPTDNKERMAEWKIFTDAYWRKLTRLGIERIASYLTDEDVLLCWCPKYLECHRSILAEFLSRNGIEVEELAKYGMCVR